MPVMHEEMHQGTSQDQEKGQHAEYMRGVFGEQVKSGDEQKAAQHDTAARAPPGTVLLMHFHCRHITSSANDRPSSRRPFFSAQARAHHKAHGLTVRSIAWCRVQP